MKLSGVLITAGLLTVPTVAGAQNPAWRMMAEADVASVCKNVEDVHPGMKDPLTPNFAASVQAACATAQASAADAESYYDWRDTMSALFTSFRDGHLNVSYQLTGIVGRWAGFLVDGRRDGYVVRYPTGMTIAANAPPEGARLVSCDGTEAEALMRARLDGRTADLSKTPERLRQAYRLLLDTRGGPGEPPIKQCIFQTEDGETVVDLAWTDIALSQLSVGPFTRRTVRGIGMEWAPDGAAWITLGNVQQEGRLTALEAEMTAQQGRLRSAPYIVFDLRNSAGGNSMWGNRLASILWGTEAVEARQLAAQSDDPRDYGKYWRASPAAARGHRANGDRFAAMGTDMAPVAAFFRGLADKIEAKSDGDATLMMDECCQPEPKPSDLPAPAQTGKVFVLTDAGTFSSSVIVMNVLKRMGAVQVGEPSGQNEVYGESITPPPLPSGLGTYRIPVSIIRQPRRDLGGLPPDHWWPGAMDDDAGLRAWIADLAAQPTT